MAQSLAHHASYIKLHLSKYRQKDLIKSEIISTMNVFSDLQPKYDTFVFSNNTKTDLLSLDGTVPVSIKGATYNIPICILLFKTHPVNPPVCFVRPTQAMTIRPSRHVDANGRVYLPYLYEWKHPDTDLIGLIQVMIIIFGENCPVYRSANQPPRIPKMIVPYPGSQPPPSQAPSPAMTIGVDDNQLRRFEADEKEPIRTEERDKMRREWEEELKQDLEQHQLEKEQLRCEKEEFQLEKGKLRCEKEEFQLEKEKVRCEKEKVQLEKGKLQKEREELEEERRKFQKEMNRIKKETESEQNGHSPRNGQLPRMVNPSTQQMKENQEDLNLNAKQSLSYGEIKNDVADLLVSETRLRIMNYLEWKPAEMENIKTSLELMAKMEETGVFSKRDISGLIKLLRKSRCVAAAEKAESYKPENIQ